MEFIITQYKLTWKFIKEKLGKPFLVIFSLSILLSLIFCAVFAKNESLTTSLFQTLSDSIEQSGLIDENNSIVFVKLFLSNCRACFTAIVLGLVPFLFLPILVLLLNCGVIGVAFAVFIISGQVSIWKLLVLGILPHGIFELPAMILSITLGCYFCLYLIKTILGKPTTESNDTIIYNIVRVFVCAIVPLLFVAAIIETYLTPILLTYL